MSVLAVSRSSIQLTVMKRLVRQSPYVGVKLLQRFIAPSATVLVVKPPTCCRNAVCLWGFRALTEFEGGLNLLHEADDDAVIWLESTATAALAK